MSTETQIELKMDDANLYLEELFTDRRLGSIRRLTPVDRNGNPDPGRAIQYFGQTQLMTPVGTLPLNFEIAAGSLAEAAQKFGEAAEVALQQTERELQQLQREAASSIVVPGQGGGFGPPGGLPRGGKFRLPG